MTTIVYKKDQFLAADKRWVGGDPGIDDTINKIITFTKSYYRIHVAMAGMRMMTEAVTESIEKYFTTEVNSADMYLLREDFKRLNLGSESFHTIIVYENLVEPQIRAWKITGTCVEEIFWPVCLWGSGAGWADGMLAVMPDINPEQLFLEISKRDVNTSHQFDIIEFSYSKLNTPF